MNAMGDVDCFLLTRGCSLAILHISSGSSSTGSYLNLACAVGGSGLAHVMVT